MQLLLISLLLLILVSSSTSTLSPSFYSSSCPNAESIIRDAVVDKQRTHPTTAAGALRLFFHDCFVGGCDASVLISPNLRNPSARVERDADINLSLPGDAFDAVVRAKTNLELSCPNTVSCADVLAVAARDLVVMLGGPHVPLLLGRKDSFVSNFSSVSLSIPLPNSSISNIIAHFESKRFTVREMVALTGAHTVGFAHCKEFAPRIYGPKVDPSLNPRFAQGLQSACKNYKQDETISVFNDIMTPSKFDNLYFQNLEKGLGLLASDQGLMGDERTRGIVREYAANETAFFGDFVRAMQKLSLYGVKTGRRGEIRRRCDMFNSFSF